MATRVHPRVVYTRISPNRSSRAGRKPVAVVVHSTEGRNLPNTSRDLVGVTDYLCRPDVPASTHVVTDGDGHSARNVRDGDKAWTCAAFNPVTLNIEQVGQAAQSSWARDEYRETARWIARWSKMYGIPIRKGRVSGSTVVRTGVLRHSDLGAAGGGHHDPGKGYDLEAVLSLAKFYRGRL